MAMNSILLAKCKNCGHRRGEHRSGDLCCPIGMKTRIGVIMFSKDYSYDPVPLTCCKMMADQFKPFTCGIHKDKWSCPDVIITEKNKVFGIIIHDGGPSFIKIKHCPWCGQNLKNIKVEEKITFDF